MAGVGGRLVPEHPGRVTLREVAAHAGVHVSTVSRALNGQAGDTRISADTEQRIVAAAESLGYRKNTIGRALRTGRSGIIGMVVPDIGNLYQSGITQAAEALLADHGYALLLASTGDRLTVAAPQVAAMIGAQAEGFLYGVTRQQDEVLQALSDSGAPVVLFNRDAPHPAGAGSYSVVLTDDGSGMQQVLAHLLELGHTHIAHTGGPEDVSSGSSRREAFTRELTAVGLAGPWLHAKRQTEDEGRRITGRLLDEHPRLTAIVAANDRLAIGAIDAVRARGLRCPQDVSVTGFNDMPYADRLDPPLTTVHVSQEELGRTAARLLLDTIVDPDRPPTTHRLPVELLVRRSTAPPPSA